MKYESMCDVQTWTCSTMIPKPLNHIWEFFNFSLVDVLLIDMFNSDLYMDWFFYKDLPSLQCQFSLLIIGSNVKGMGGNQIRIQQYIFIFDMLLVLSTNYFLMRVSIWTAFSCNLSTIGMGNEFIIHRFVNLW